MFVAVTLEQVKKLAPNPIADYAQAFTSGQAVLDAAGITANPLRVAHFMAQVVHESGRLKAQRENLNYSTPDRIQAVFGKKRFPTLAEAQPFVNNPQALANKVYNGRMGNTPPNDGWTYRGGGMIQITGKTYYRTIGKAAGLDLVAHPELACTAAGALQVACAVWNDKGCSAFADQDDLEKVTYAINGGYNGIDDRRQLLTEAKTIWP